MDYEKEIKELKRQLTNLQNAVIQMSKNTVPVTEKTDNTANQVKIITPFEETKKTYYGEKEKTFYDVPNGNVSIFFDNYEGEYKTSRIGNRFIVSFPEKLEKATNITVMVQN